MSNKRKIITLGVASATAIIAALFARDFIAAEQPQPVIVQKVDSAEVLVVNQDVKFGQAIRPAMLQWQPWPKEHLLPGMITREEQPDAMEKLASVRVRAPMVAGEPLMESKLVGKRGGFLAMQVRKGMRAFTIKATEETAVGGMVERNDRVDVILTRQVRSIDGSGEKQVSDVVLENVRVLAVNRLNPDEVASAGGGAGAGEEGADAAAMDDQLGPSELRTATLEVTPHQAEVLAQVQSMGELSLALRSVDENDERADPLPRLTPKFIKSASGGVRLFRYGRPAIQIVGN